MWPIYVLLNKLLKAEGHNVREDEDDMGIESYNFKQSLRFEKVNKGVLSQSHFVEVPHIKQLRTWDCGLACVLMVLRTLGINDYDIEDLGELCRTTSVWTVDLAYLLQKLSIRFSYFTVTLGANPNFSVETFYKEQLPDDIGRVDTLFRRSVEAGINIECRSIKGEEIVFLILSGKYIAIALVDQYILSRPWTEDAYISEFYSGTSAYTGHYVVICGYDALSDEFEIRDPASSRYINVISPSVYVFGDPCSYMNPFSCNSPPTVTCTSCIKGCMLHSIWSFGMIIMFHGWLNLLTEKTRGSHRDAWKKLVNLLAQTKISS